MVCLRIYSILIPALLLSALHASSVEGIQNDEPPHEALMEGDGKDLNDAWTQANEKQPVKDAHEGHEALDGDHDHDHDHEGHEHEAHHDHNGVQEHKLTGLQQLTVDNDSKNSILDISVNLTERLVEKKEALVFLRELFQKYGDKDIMTYEGFEHLLESIGLAKIKIKDHGIGDHHTNEGFKEFHSDHNHTREEDEMDVLEHDHHQDDVQEHDDHSDHDHEDHDHDHEDHDLSHADHSHDEHVDVRNKTERSIGKKKGSSKRQRRRKQKKTNPERTRRAVEIDLEEPPAKCLSPREILSMFNIPSQNGITPADFLFLCPSIIYQIDEHMCHFHSEVGDEHDHGNHSHDHVGVTRISHFTQVPAKVWGWAVLAVTIISLVGLLSVAIIPIMQKVFYNHLLQFLVALAIGSLTGDALLHLIPHALVPHDKSSHGHDDGDDEDGGHGHSKEALWKGMMVLVGVYVFFIAERLMSMLTEWKRTRAKTKRTHHHKKPSLKTKEDLEKSIGSKLSRHDDYYASCQEFVMVVHSSKGLKKMAEDRHEELKELKECTEEQNECNEVENDETVHHNHSHHGHSHGADSVPTSISNVAWMVIMGDGLHNFSDGLAIGASFANGITGGLSTSIAVFCHELPHELGDFAVLLRAGMPVKQALFYNIVSSVLCFMGMVIGVLVGNIEEVSLWIFALAGGMFIYISLVDMLPEITSVETRPGEGRCCHLLLQTLGITVGISIMLLIALFEDKIAINIGEDVV